MQPGWQFRSAMAAEGKKEPKSHVSRREKAITHLTAERDETLRKVELPEREKEELPRRLMMYENPHTTPFLQRKEKKKQEETWRTRWTHRRHQGDALTR